MAATADRRRAGISATLAVLGTLVVVLVALWAATAGQGELLRGSGLDPERRTIATPTPTETTATATPTEDSDGEAPVNSDWLVVLVLAVLAGAALLILGLITVAVYSAARQTRHLRLRGREPTVLAGEVDLVPAVVTAIAEDATEQEAALFVGTPRNGIVECWQRFEDRAEQVGATREPWETSAEFTLRLLDHVSADGHAVAELAALYREARFSEHEMDEADRRRALDLLRRIHDTLRLPTPPDSRGST